MNLLELAESLQGYDSVKLENGVLVAFKHEEGIPLAPTWAMPLKDLDKIDTRLGLAIEGWLAHNRSNGDFSNTVYASLLRETALYWTGTKMIPTDWGVIPYHKLCYFSSVDLEATPPRVVIVVQRCVTMPYTAENGTEVRHVMGFGGMTRPVDIEWLNAEFPGWQQRYAAALGLGYENEELLGHVLVKGKPTPSVVVKTEGITFD